MSDTEPTYDGITATQVEQLSQLARITTNAARALGCNVSDKTIYWVDKVRDLESIARAIGRTVRYGKDFGSGIAYVDYHNITIQTFTGEVD